MITEIENLAAFNTAIANEKCSVVDFYATWCGPCKMIHPRFEKFSETYTNISFYQVNVDQAEDVTAHCGIQCMPTFKFFKAGQLIKEIQGANVRAIEDALKENN
eukprot:jgi/Orpsp1_1/1192467/evm.model.d7180000093538.1